MQIQWYPGHMTKARRMMAQNLSLIDVVVELVDARAPYATRNPDFDDLFAGKSRAVILNKSDLANEQTTQKWAEYYRAHGWVALTCTATESGGRKMALALIERAAKEKGARLREKGLRKTVRVMVVGIPNVGKSTLINKLAGTTMAATGNRPGVTRGKQWVKISPYLELMDTPGMLWPKFTDEQTALRLAYLGSIRDEIIDGEELSIALLEDLAARVPDLLAQRYKKLDAAQAGEALLEGVCKSRGFILPGGVLDLERGAKTVLDEFRAGKIGRISLERPEDIRAAEPAGEAASAKPEELP